MAETFHDIPAFAAVVEAGGFSRAARRLNVSRSAVGKSVARLEDRLGVRLFNRTTRRQSLTDDGHTFYERCKRALEELRAGEAMLESGRTSPSGKLRVSVPVLFGRLCIAPVLMRLAATHSELELDLNFSDRLVDLIEDGLDLAVRMGSAGDASGLMVRRIAREHTVVCASPTYIEKYGAPSSLADLGRHQLLTYARSGRVQSWIFPRKGASAQVVIPPSRLHFDDLGTMADLVVAGFGLAWLPLWLVRDPIRSGQIVTVLAHLPAYVSDVFVIWPEAPYLPTRVRVAIDALAAEVPTVGDL
jgi:DNA-binding transcriptional LysR family regulator